MKTPIIQVYHILHIKNGFFKRKLSFLKNGVRGKGFFFQILSLTDTIDIYLAWNSFM